MSDGDQTPALTLRPPPSLPDPDTGSGAMLGALPMLGSVGSIMLIGSLGAGSGGRHLLAGAAFLLATTAFVAVQLDRQHRRRRRQLATSRAGYLAHLSRVRAEVRRLAADRRRELELALPPPWVLPARAQAGVRLWRRVPGEEGYAAARLGTALGPLGPTLSVPETEPDPRVDPACATALHDLLHTHRRVPDLPVTLPLDTTPLLRLGGPVAARRAVARALVCSAVAGHAPDHLAVLLAVGDDSRPHWEWAKWLPHRVRDPDEAAGRLLLVVVDGAPVPAGPPEGGRCLVEVTVPPEVAARPDEGAQGEVHLRLTDDGDDRSVAGRLRQRGAPARPLRADRCDPATAEALARRLARRANAGPGGGVPAGLADLVAADPTPLRVPIGTDADDRPVRLDLREAAQGGDGPHGLLVGATGSGKSELLRTLVLALALRHPSDEVNLVLVDFKGGATFTPLARLPHVSALITNLADELSLVGRMADALTGELVRRQELLRAAGVSSVVEYAAARARGAALAPLPALVIVVDEFAELLAARPELLEEFVTIGRVGRSLGLHLLLATQRLEEGRLQGLESHLSYRIALRTFSDHESRTVLGVPDAHRLPQTPGAGYLRTGPDAPQRFTATYVSGPAPRRGPAPGRHASPRIEEFSLDDPPLVEPAPLVEPRVRSARERVACPEEPRDEASRRETPADRPTVLDDHISRLAAHGGPSAHRIWLPPLDEPPDLLELLAGDGEGPPDGLPVAVVDRPAEQRRDVLTLDLDGAGGHLAVVGAPRTGKSTVLRTVLGGLAVRCSPEAVQVFALDLTGPTTAEYAAGAHLVARAGRHDTELAGRIVDEVARLVDRREAGVDDDRYGRVFLLVDGWAVLRHDLPELEERLTGLAARGLAVGVHLVATAARWADLRTGLRETFGSRLELRLGDPLDSEVDRRAAAAVPRSRPGRGLAPDGHQLLTAVPDADRLLTLARERWPGLSAPWLRLLPTRVGLAEMPPADGESGLLLGVGEPDLEPTHWRPETDPHLLVLGDPGSGRTATLRTLLRQLVERHPPEAVQLVVVDPRRGLLGEVPETHLLDHLATPDRVAGGLAELAAHLDGRLPGPDVGPRQLRERSWWTGPEVYLAVDDQELVSTDRAAPLTPLVPLLPHGAEIGLHVLLTRRTAGAARALFDPVVAGIRDLGMPGLLLAGSPDEGPLLGGVRARPQPPGRGRWVTRAGDRLVQVVWTDPRM